MLTVRFLADATRVIVADTLTSMLQTCQRLDKYKKEFSEMLLEQDGGGGRTAGPAGSAWVYCVVVGSSL